MLIYYYNFFFFAEIFVSLIRRSGWPLKRSNPAEMYRYFYFFPFFCSLESGRSLKIRKIQICEKVFFFFSFDCLSIIPKTFYRYPVRKHLNSVCKLLFFSPLMFMMSKKECLSPFQPGACTIKLFAANI